MPGRSASACKCAAFDSLRAYRIGGAQRGHACGGEGRGRADEREESGLAHHGVSDLSRWGSVGKRTGKVSDLVHRLGRKASFFGRDRGRASCRPPSFSFRKFSTHCGNEPRPECVQSSGPPHSSPFWNHSLGSGDKEAS